LAEISYRDVRASDLAALSAIMSDWEVVRQLGSWPWPHDLAFTASRCHPYRGNGFVWAIVRDGQMIGTVGVTEGTFGYCLRRDQWGQGIGSASARTAIAHAFDNPALEKITAEVWADNLPSMHILIKLGFAVVMIETLHAKARAVPTLLQRLVLTRPRWQTLSNPGQSANAGA
jgi:RimJ/RimL family protein N-acetyltransferase